MRQRPAGRWRGWRARRAALRYAERGWAVVPGAFRVGGGGFDCGNPGCWAVACHPALPGWATRASTDPAILREWWRARPYTVLLTTGRAFDVLEVPAAMGRIAVGAEAAGRPARGPVAVAPGGRWMFWVRTGHALLPELAGRPGVVLHAGGSWVPAPPSEQAGGRVRWVRYPESFNYRPAEPYAVQALLLSALQPVRPRRALISPVPVRDVG